MLNCLFATEWLARIGGTDSRRNVLQYGGEGRHSDSGANEDDHGIFTPLLMAFSVRAVHE